MNYLPDSNILIYTTKNNPHVCKLISQWLDQERLSLSVIAISEFIVKAIPSEIKHLNYLKLVCPIFPVTLEVAEQAAQYRKVSLKKDTKKYLLNCYLAATAKIHNLTLVTRNTADYPTDIKIFNPFAHELKT